MRSSEPDPLVALTGTSDPAEAAPSRGIPAGSALTLVGSASAAEPAESAVPRWGQVKRLLFRFAFSYLVLYNLPFPLELFFNLFAKVMAAYQRIWGFVVPWVGDSVFHADTSVLPNGSGDVTYSYVQVFCFLMLALAATAFWTFLDRRRPNYVRLHEWLRVYVRFALAMTMLSYGAVKVFPSQFPSPGPDRLLQPFGDASPMGLLWTFMGASAAYTFFAGASEMLGGLLLTTRRTALLCALVSIGVMTNVVMLNFCYDVPVKLFSAHLLAMAVFLALPDLGRLASLLVLNRGVEPAPMRPLFARKWLDRGALVLRTVCVLAYTVLLLNYAHQNSRRYGSLAPKPPLYGIWNVEEFVVDGRARPPLATDGTRWQRVIFSNSYMVAIQLMNDSRQRYMLEHDTARKRLGLSKLDDLDWKSTLSYKQLGPRLLAIEGSFDGHRLRARLRRVDAPEFRLVRRGFHWINEYPYNR